MSLGCVRSLDELETPFTDNRKSSGPGGIISLLYSSVAPENVGMKRPMNSISGIAGVSMTTVGCDS
jgi:hypothetical protein